MALLPSQSPLLFLSLLLVSSLQISPAWSLVPGGFRAVMTHVDSSGNFTRLQSIHRSLKRGESRMARLVARMTTTLTASEAPEAPVHAGEGEFIMDLAIGTPGLPFPAIVDTGSDLTWTQCKPCDDCFQQATPVFDPSESSTFAKLPCSGDLCLALPVSSCKEHECRYSYSYGDRSITQGFLASETFGFGPTGNITVPGIGFGCGEANSGGGFSQASGLVGLGHGPLSLISQLGLGQFSYCLTNFGESTKSPLLFGSLANAFLNKINAEEVRTTPLIKNTYQPSLYYLNLTGITVGGVLLGIPSTTFSLAEDGTGGMIIDSGTSITHLERAGYDKVKKAFLSQVQLPVADGSSSDDIGLDVCFMAPRDPSAQIKVPKMMFHFDGADLVLPPENYLVFDEGSGLLCLTVMGSSGISIFGNFQQQNMQVLYDLKNEKVSFAPAQCDRL